MSVKCADMHTMLQFWIGLLTLRNCNDPHYDHFDAQTMQLGKVTKYIGTTQWNCLSDILFLMASPSGLYLILCTDLDVTRNPVDTKNILTNTVVNFCETTY